MASTKHINFPTQNRGHILDLVCSTDHIPINDLTITNLSISPYLTNLQLPSLLSVPFLPPNKNVYFASANSNRASTLMSLLIEQLFLAPLSDTQSTLELTSIYNSTLSSCVDQLAPWKTKTVSFTHSALWFTPTLSKLKSKGFQL